MARVRFIGLESEYPRAISDDQWGLIGSFLTLEVRDESIWSDYWQPPLQQGLLDQKFTWQGGGNAHSVDIIGERTIVTNYYLSEDAAIELSNEKMLHIAEEWFRAINSGHHTDIVFDY